MKRYPGPEKPERMILTRFKCPRCGFHRRDARHKAACGKRTA